MDKVTRIMRDIGDAVKDEFFWTSKDEEKGQQENASCGGVQQRNCPRPDAVFFRKKDKSQPGLVTQTKEQSDFVMVCTVPERLSENLQIQFGDDMTASLLGNKAADDIDDSVSEDFVFCEDTGYNFHVDEELDATVVSKTDKGFDGPWRGQVVTAQKWASYFDADGSIKDVDVQHVKKAIFRGGIDPGIRKDVWKFLLGCYAWDSTRASREQRSREMIGEYVRLKTQWESMSSKQIERFSLFRDRQCLIEKDVIRTDRTVSYFAGDNNRNVKRLSNILTTYCMYNFDLGYVQGMSDLLSPILAVMDNEVDAFWCFSGLMDRLGNNFAMDQKATLHQLKQMKIMLWYHDSEFYSYLKRQESSDLYCCFRWILILFKREFSFEEIPRLWEVIFTGLPCKNFHLLFAIAILDSQKLFIMDKQLDCTGILQHINGIRGTIRLNNMLMKAEEIGLSMIHSTTLPWQIHRFLSAESPMSSP